MGTELSTATTEEIKATIHGEHVIESMVCDYCAGPLVLDEPILYDIIRVSDLPGLTSPLGAPTTWVPDAARCSYCETEELVPATRHFDEVLAMVCIREMDGMVSLDCSTLAPVDFSPADSGFEPLYIDIDVLRERLDLGLPRWIRLQQLLHLDVGLISPEGLLQAARAQSKEVPPEILTEILL